MGFLFPETSCCSVVSGCTPGPFKMESSSLRGGKKKKKTGHKVLIHTRYKVHPATEKLSLKAHLCCALDGLLEAVWVLNQPCHDRNIFLDMLCLPKSLSYERFQPRQGGLRHSCVCVCVCPNASDSKKKKQNKTQHLMALKASCELLWFLLEEKTDRQLFCFSETKG